MTIRLTAINTNITPSTVMIVPATVDCVLLEASLSLDLLNVKTPMTANTPISPPAKAVALATPLSDMSSVTTDVIGSGEAAPKSAIGINCQSTSAKFASLSGVAVVTPKSPSSATSDWSVGDPDQLTQSAAALDSKHRCWR